MSRILFERSSGDEDKHALSYVRATIQRFDPQRPAGQRSWQQTYHVALEKPISVFDLLHRIYTELDPTLAFRTQQCNQGICNVCRMKVNGESVRVCQTLVMPGETIEIAAMDDARQIRDLVIE